MDTVLSNNFILFEILKYTSNKTDPKNFKFVSRNWWNTINQNVQYFRKRFSIHVYLQNKVYYVDQNIADYFLACYGLTEIYLPNHFDTKIFEGVLEILKHYQGKVPEVPDDWATKFFDSVFTICPIIGIANFLEIRSLINLCNNIVVNLIRGKTPDEIHKLFSI